MSVLALDYTEMIFGTAGGLGLFLFGMGLMSEGLKKVAGEKLKNILESMTKKRVVACLVGAGVTALIQSSSAATVMVIGFINAGLLTLKQAISVIIGTNVGTTATAWLVGISGLEAFKISHYALPAVALGFALTVFAKKRTVRDLGQIMLGFGILFIGIGFMKDSFAGLEKSDAVHHLFIQAAEHPLLAILAGIAVTMLIQSSSAAVASVQLLAAGGAFGADWGIALTVAIPFILGSNIGTTITAQIAALRTNRNAKRAAWAHTIFNVLGAFICFWFIGWIAKFTGAFWQLGPTNIAMSIAVAHTGIKAFEAAFFLPLTGLLEKMVLFLIKVKPEEMEAHPVVLEERLLSTPVIALEQAKREIVRMARIARMAVNRAIKGLLEDDRGPLELVMGNEDAIDDLQHAITKYLISLSKKQLSDQVSVELPVFLHTVNDLERVGDHAVNIAEIAHRKIDTHITFSDSALAEANSLRDEIDLMFERILVALKDNDTETARLALVNENRINRMQVDLRRSHVQRMSDNLCLPEAGLIFIDLVDNVEKIGDHLVNIAQAVIGGLQWDDIDENMLTGEYETPVLD